MRVEERLARALHAEADRVWVDIPVLYAGTRERLAARPARRRLVPLVAAAAIVLLVLGGLFLGTLRRDAAQPAHQTSRGQVHNTFSCPHQQTLHYGPGLKDLSFVPGLARGPRWEADQFDAPRFEYEAGDGRATLRLGNADGTLASVSRFRWDGQWQDVTATRCVGAAGSALVPAARLGVLGRHGFTPWPATALFAPGPVVLVDDRGHYDPAGLVRHLSMYARPCGPDVCLASGAGMPRDPASPGDSLLMHVRAGVPEDLSRLILGGDLPPRSQPYQLWGLTGSTGFAASLKDGPVLDAQRFAGPTWIRPLYLLLAPRGQVVKFSVTAAHSTMTFTPDRAR
jgi:hypothetical protein